MTLILHKGYEETTVQDILEEADVGRSTFYAHYSGKEDLLRRGFEMLRADLAEAQRAARANVGSRDEPLGFSLAMFQHAAGHVDVYRAMVGGRGHAIALAEIRRVLLDTVKKELSGIDGDAIPNELFLQFVVGTFHIVLTWWLERRPKLPAAQVDAMFRRLVLYGVHPVLRRG
jgi:AcrR family transcriptional regulator